MVSKEKLEQIKKLKKEYLYLKSKSEAAYVLFQSSIVEALYEADHSIEDCVLCLSCGEIRESTQKLCACEQNKQ